jgi:LysM repeat protein
MTDTIRVAAGDTLGKIASRLGMSVKALADANGIGDVDKIRVGQVLTVPTGTGAPPPPPSAAAGTVTVKAGDTLGKIAARTNSSVKALAEANGIRDVDNILVGQVLTVPGSALPSKSPGPATPAAEPKPAAPPTPGGTSDRFGADNLKLGVNDDFADAIKEAAEKTGMACQTVAAIINAEAAKDRGGKWLANSKAGTSTASGLTQFLDGTWRDEAQRAGGLLNAEAKALGLVSAANAILNSVKLLALRFDPRMSILAGADFARNNIAVMRRAGVIGGSIDPAGLAKLAYLAHHEGAPGAIKFLKGDMSYVKQATFNANVAASNRASFMARGGQNLGRAYRIFLAEYVDRNIVVTNFMKTVAGVTVPALSSFFKA